MQLDANLATRAAADAIEICKCAAVTPASDSGGETRARAVAYLGPLRRGRAHDGLRGVTTWKPYNPYPPLPRSTVRDLLGITRALYRVTLAEDPKDVVKLQALTDIGKGFRRALEKCTGHTGTIPYMEGWQDAERATKALCDLVGDAQPLAPLVKAAGERVKQEPFPWPRQYGKPP